MSIKNQETDFLKILHLLKLEVKYKISQTHYFSSIIPAVLSALSRSWPAAWPPAGYVHPLPPAPPPQVGEDRGGAGPPSAPETHPHSRRGLKI